MKSTHRFTLVCLIATNLISFACEKTEATPQPALIKHQGDMPKKGLRLESEKAGYKFYWPCINYAGKTAKNEGC